MPAAYVLAVAGRVLLIQFHIAQKPGPCVTAFQEVVAQNSVVGKAAVESLPEDVHVVDALADERTFAEQVLIHIGDGAGVGVDADLAGAHQRIPRTVRAGQADRHPRLQDSVAGRDTAARLVVAGAVQRMGHGAHEPARRVAGQLRVGVQGDDESDIRQDGRVADDEREAVRRVGLTLAEQGVQIPELAALAFVAHPGPLGGVVSTRTMEQGERAARIARVFCVQFFDHVMGLTDKFLVIRQGFLCRVGKVREQGEVEVPIAVPQEPDFEIVDQFFDAARAGEHRRDHDQGPRLGRNALGKVHARQQARSGQERGQPIREGHRQMAAAEHEERTEKAELPAGQSVAVGLGRKKRGQHGRQEHDAAAIEPKPPAEGAQRRSGRPAHLHEPLKPGKSVIDQIETDMRLAFLVLARRAFPGQFQRPARHLGFGVWAFFCRLFNKVAIAVAGGKIHPAVDGNRVLPKNALDRAQGLDKIVPVRGVQGAQAADAVADGDLV
ncbi:hypothetical protein DSECCO2_362080 [anaerobic digester metagenome]